MKPLVSIVTPSLNSRQFIEGTLLTVRGQTYPNCEHIVIDGGSTDGTLELLERYSKTYNLRYVVSQDGGIYEAINKGLRLAQGEILADLDADDLYLPWSVETAVKHLERTEIIFGDAMSADTDRGQVTIEPRLPFIRAYYSSGASISQPTVFWRRSLMDQIGSFDESLRLLADVEYWLRACHRGFRPKKVNEVLAIARCRSASAGRAATSNPRREAEMAVIRKRYKGSALWGRLPVTPLLRRLCMIVYWTRVPGLWPKLRLSGAVPMRWADLRNSLGYRNRRQSLAVDWSRLLPSGVKVL